MKCLQWISCRSCLLARACDPKPMMQRMLRQKATPVRNPFVALFFIICCFFSSLHLMLLGVTDSRIDRKRRDQERDHFQRSYPRSPYAHSTTLIRWVSRSCLQTSCMITAEASSSLSSLTPKTRRQDSIKALFPDHNPNAVLT